MTGTSTSYCDAIAYLAYNRRLDLQVISELHASRATHRTTQLTTLIALAYYPDTPDQERRAVINAFPAADLNYAPPDTNPPNQGLAGLPADAATILCLESAPDTSPLVALTPNLPDAITQHLLRDTDPAVRAGLALNPTTPDWARTQLQADSNTRVRATAT